MKFASVLLLFSLLFSCSSKIKDNENRLRDLNAFLDTNTAKEDYDPVELHFFDTVVVDCPDVRIKPDGTVYIIKSNMDWTL